MKPANTITFLILALALVGGCGTLDESDDEATASAEAAERVRPASSCTLYGYVTPVPAPSVQMWCSPPSTWFAINDTTGFYSCSTSAGTVAIHPTGASNKNCSCTAPSKQCNYP